MKNIRYGLLTAALLFISSSSVALADPVSLPGSPTGPLPFTLTCSPYTAPMITSVDYSPDGGFCTFTIPQQGSFKAVGIYKGTPGNSVPVKRGFTISNAATVLTDTNYNFSGAQNGDTYFAASYSSDDFDSVLATDSWLQNGSGSSVTDLTTTSWHWGATPPVSISSPEPGHTYSSGESVLPLVNFTDIDSYASITYSLNGTPVDPSLPLPLSTLPSGPATFVIAATNAGGTTFATSTFTIVGGRTPLTITANNAQMALGSPVPALTATLTGFVAPDSALSSDVTGQAACTTTATSGSAPGNYPIVCTKGSLVSPTNYAFTFFVTGTLTITTPTPPADTAAPVITINTPVKNGIYGKSETVFLTATVTDASAIAATTYWFNGVKINPAVKLPLANAPIISKVSVSAKDIHGNTATTTQAFYVVKSTSSCLIDIIQILLAIKMDKTLPDKPTLENLIADCKCFSFGAHRWDLH